MKRGDSENDSAQAQQGADPAGLHAERAQKRDYVAHLVWYWARRRLSFNAEGGTSNLTRDLVAQGKSPSKPPPPAGEDVRQLDRRWRGAKSGESRRAVARDALSLLEHLTTPNADIRIRRDTLEWKHAIAIEDRPAETVARMYGVSRATVFNYRQEFRETPANVHPGV